MRSHTAQLQFTGDVGKRGPSLLDRLFLLAPYRVALIEQLFPLSYFI